MRRYSDSEVAFLFGKFLDDEAENNPVVEAEHHTFFVTLPEETQRTWREHHGPTIAIEMTQERWFRFLLQNPDVLLGWLL